MTSALKRAGQADEAAVTQAEANRLEAEASILTLEGRYTNSRTHSLHYWEWCPEI